MGSLTSTGQHISQDVLTTKHMGHAIEVWNYEDDVLDSSHSLAEGGEGLN